MTAARQALRSLAPARLRWIAVALALCALAAAPAGASAAFQVGMQDVAFDGDASPQQTAAGYNLLNAAHGSVVRLNAFWYNIAPGSPQTGFDASNPADPQYKWSTLDAAVRNAVNHHATPILTLLGAPAWAEGPNEPQNPAFGFRVWDPNAADYAQFVQAAARRYSGQFKDSQNQTLPRVRYFEIWNEENIPLFLAAPNLAATYRALITGAYSAIKSVDRSDMVVLGGLAPLGYSGSPGPLKMGADLLCLRRVGTRFVKVSGCTAVPFDIFAQHPYSLGVTPTETVPDEFRQHHVKVPAYAYDDVRVGDFYKVRNLLNASERLHTIGNRRPPLWVTEWGWDTNPPDHTSGDRFKAAARYVAYSMYAMYKQRASVIIWQQIHDPLGSNGLPGSGLETRSGQRKPSLQAFTFPFFASVSHRRGFGWGRAPVPGHTKVLVQRQTRHGYKTVASARTGSDGVFTVHFSASGNATYRAQVSHGPKSLPYNSAPIPAKFTH